MTGSHPVRKSLQVQEKTVQKRAIGFLEKHYNNWWWKRKIFVAEEVRTKRLYGGKRADGLLVYQGRLTGKPYVVSMEAKSKKTISAIAPYHDMGRWWYNSLRFGVFAGLGTGLFFLAGQATDLATPLMILFWSIMAGIAYGLLTWNTNRHKTVDVITQLKQYPANEQWLTFSEAAFQSLKEKKQKALRQICQYQGIGILLICPNKKNQILTKPSGRWYWFWDGKAGWQWISDFLVYYSKEKEIRAMI